MSEQNIHVTVFKNHFPARTFKVHPGWIFKLSLTLLALALLVVGSIFFSARVYRQAMKSSPHRVQELERELTELRLTLQNVKAEKATAGGTPTTDATQASTPTSGTAEDSLPIRLLPASIKPSASGSATIQLDDLKVKWTAGKNLRVQFNIQYIRGDGGNQQGRILIMARGQNNLYVYPEGSINSEDKGTLITEESGEHFSVSRFRGVLAQFGPFTSKADIQWVEILILNDAGEIMIHQKLKASQIQERHESQ